MANKHKKKPVYQPGNYVLWEHHGMIRDGQLGFPTTSGWDVFNLTGKGIYQISASQILRKLEPAEMEPDKVLHRRAAQVGNTITMAGVAAARFVSHK